VEKWSNVPLVENTLVIISSTILYYFNHKILNLTSTDHRSQIPILSEA
jgi:hypothetical protein